MSRRMKAKRFKPALVPQPIKLDFGCGPNPRQGFEGVDRIAFPNVIHVLDIGKDRWPWKDGSVSEFHASHFLEHLTSKERVHFFNELYRVLEPGMGGKIITPHWCSNRAYGDFTHQWPPVSEMFWYYLNKEWRAGNAPHTDAAHNPEGYKCDFDATWNYTLNPSMGPRSDEYRLDAIQHYKEAINDMEAHVKAKK